MKLPLYISSKTFNCATPIEADETLITSEDFENKDVNIEFFIVALMLSHDSLKELQAAAETSEYPNVVFFHRGKCIDAVFFHEATDDYAHIYTSETIAAFLSAIK